MNKYAKKILPLFLSATLCASVLAGCNKPEAKESEALKQETSVKSTVGLKLPLEQPVTLKYYLTFSSTVIKSMADSELYKELEKRTGIKIDFIHPPSGQSGEVLNLMIASRDLPDIFEGGLGGYSGGALKAYEDGVIVDLTDLQKKYAPNLTAMYAKYPDLLIDLQTEKGQILHTPFIRGHESLLTSRGPIMRNDWLKDLGLKEPSTIDEWYTVLKAFKEKKGATAPITGLLADLKFEGFTGAFGTMIANGNEFYLENGKVVYGPISPKFKNYITTLRKWYQEGLIDSEMPVNTQKALDAKITNGQAGVLLGGYVGSSMGNYLTLMAPKDPKFDLIGVQYPVQKAGDLPFYVHTSKVVNTTAGSCSISSTSKYQKEAMAYLDYGYSKEGHMLFNFGIEGQSYKMDNGYPKYTDTIMKNPEGHSFAAIAPKYFRSYNNGPFIQDPRYLEQYYTMPQQLDAYKKWSKYQKQYVESNTTIRGNLTPDENAKITPKMTEINTYKDEMFLKWLLGQESLEKFDAYAEQIKKMGIDEVIKAKQDAYDRFIKQYPNAAKPKSYNVVDIFK